MAFSNANSSQPTEKGLELVSGGQAIKIGPDLVGLYNYLSAHNIRQKVKHPLFMQLKF
jgi:hypothetical protein